MHRIVQASRIHKRKLIIIGAVLLGILLLVQLFYPGDRLPLNARIDGLNVSAWKKQDAAWQLDKQAASQRIDIRLGTSKETYEAVEPGDIGLAIKNKSRVEKADYPWWARLVPTSVFWYGFGMDDGQVVQKGSKVVTLSDGPAALNMGSDNQFVDPMLTADFHLQAGSPAGNKAKTLTASYPTTDCLGRPRIKGDKPDIGPFEDL